MKIEQIKNYNWEQYWVGNWSFLTSCYLGHCYTKILKEQIGEGFEKAIIVSRKGYTGCYFDKQDRKKYGKFVGAKITADNESVLCFSDELKSRADNLVGSIHFLKKKDEISSDDYRKFVAEFMNYNGPHISVRHTIDFLSTDKQKVFLEIFRELRLYVERVHSETEKFMILWAEQMAKKFQVEPKLILCLTHDEVDEVLGGEALPELKLLNNRYAGSAVLFDVNGYNVYVRENVKKIENNLEREMIGDILTGQTAYKGKTKGKVKTIFNPILESEKFNNGDVLVTGMTRPEFLPLMEKASAFITDAGGILSHAAIVARELKKPCIIGTKIATKVLKDGDFVEVDADKGIVKILKKAND